MNIPNFENTQFVDKNGFLTDGWKQLLTQLFNTLQTDAGDEGLVAPTVSSAMNSVDPPTLGGQVVQIQNKLTNQGLASSHTLKFGTFIYDSNTEKAYVALPSPVLPIFREIVVI